MKLKAKILTVTLASLLAFSFATTSALMPKNTANAATNGGSITIDTANYKMDKNNRYQIGVNIKRDGVRLSGDEVKELISRGVLKVTDSRTGSIVDLEQLSNGDFLVTGKNYGSCYIIYSIYDGEREINHASIKIDVEKGVKQGGLSVRNTSVFDSRILDLAQKSNETEESFYKNAVGTFVLDENSLDKSNVKLAEISCIDGRYFIEVLDNYDWKTMAEIEILRENAIRATADTNYRVKIYPFSGFSFGGEYQGAGEETYITAKSNGDIETFVSSLFGANIVTLTKTNGAYIHPLMSQKQANKANLSVAGSYKEILTYTTVDDKNNKILEQTEVFAKFSEDGGFVAFSKTQDRVPSVFFGHYTMNTEGSDTIGAIFCEKAGYSSAPIEWNFYIDNETGNLGITDFDGNSPFIAQQKFLLKKTEEGKSILTTAGPGARSSEIQARFIEFSKG